MYWSAGAAAAAVTADWCIPLLDGANILRYTWLDILAANAADGRRRRHPCHRPSGLKAASLELRPKLQPEDLEVASFEELAQD